MWKFFALSFFFLFVSAINTAHAAIYQCRTHDGTTHFTNLAGAKKGRCKLLVRTSKRRRESFAEAPAATPAGLPTQEGRSAAVAMPASLDLAPPPATSPFDDHIRGAAQLYQLPEALIRAVVHIESSFRPQAVSGDGAIGLMQLMPQTAASMGVRDALDPYQNIYGGARYLRVLANRFEGDMVLTLAAYNAGQGAVDRYRGVPPYPETQRYVRNVLQAYRSLVGDDASSAPLATPPG